MAGEASVLMCASCRGCCRYRLEAEPGIVCGSQAVAMDVAFVAGAVCVTILRSLARGDTVEEARPRGMFRGVTTSF